MKPENVVLSSAKSHKCAASNRAAVVTPAQYAKREIAAGRFPNMPVYSVAGSFYLCDADWNILSDGKTYTSQDAALTDRSRILDRARQAAA